MQGYLLSLGRSGSRQPQQLGSLRDGIANGKYMNCFIALNDKGSLSTEIP